MAVPTTCIIASLTAALCPASPAADQHRDLPEWLEHHGRLGVRHAAGMRLLGSPLAASPPTVTSACLPCAPCISNPLQHKHTQVSLTYVVDTGSEPPLDAVLAPFVAAGRVVHVPLGNATAVSAALRNHTCIGVQPRYMQLLAYTLCLHEYGGRHQWMGALGVATGAVGAACHFPASSLPRSTPPTSPPTLL